MSRTDPHFAATLGIPIIDCHSFKRLIALDETLETLEWSRDRIGPRIEPEAGSRPPTGEERPSELDLGSTVARSPLAGSGAVGGPGPGGGATGANGRECSDFSVDPDRWFASQRAPGGTGQRKKMRPLRGEKIGGGWGRR